jgi:predicted nuclease of predicted toxin-antitoxin system
MRFLVDWGVSKRCLQLNKSHALTENNALNEGTPFCITHVANIWGKDPGDDEIFRFATGAETPHVIVTADAGFSRRASFGNASHCGIIYFKNGMSAEDHIKRLNEVLVKYADKIGPSGIIVVQKDTDTYHQNADPRCTTLRNKSKKGMSVEEFMKQPPEQFVAWREACLALRMSDSTSRPAALTLSLC